VEGVSCKVASRGSSNAGRGDEIVRRGLILFGFGNTTKLRGGQKEHPLWAEGTIYVFARNSSIGKAPPKGASFPSQK